MRASIQFIHEELKGIYPADEYRVLSELIIRNLFHFTRTDYMLNQDRRLSSEERSKVREVVERLKKKEPLQYIVGEADFYGLIFQVNPSTLIPRPETEELVHWIIERNAGRKMKILDIGTGSGCIAVSLAANLPMAQVFAADISESALETAKANAQRNGVEVSFFRSDILDFGSCGLLMDTCFDLIVSNPPYVRECEKRDMMANVLDYEPASALFVSDHDPLVFYRAIAQYAQSNLQPSGQLFFEINEYLPAEMEQLLAGMGYRELEIRKDINGRFRMMRSVKA